MTINWQASYYRYRRYFTSLGQFYQGKKTRTYAGIILSTLTTTFFLTIAIRPTLVTIASLVKQIDDQKTTTKMLNDKINTLSQAQREYEMAKNDLYLVDQALPRNPEISSLIKQLEILSYQSGVVPENIKIGQTEIMNQLSVEKEEDKETTNQPTKIKLAVSGDYQKLKIFLHSLSTLRRITLVDSFNFKAEKGEKQTLILDLEANVHYLQPKYLQPGKNQPETELSQEENDHQS